MKMRTLLPLDRIPHGIYAKDENTTVLVRSRVDDFPHHHIRSSTILFEHELDNGRRELHSRLAGDTDHKPILRLLTRMIGHHLTNANQLRSELRVDLLPTTAHSENREPITNLDGARLRRRRRTLWRLSSSPVRIRALGELPVQGSSRIRDALELLWISSPIRMSVLAGLPECPLHIRIREGSEIETKNSCSFTRSHGHTLPLDVR